MQVTVEDLSTVKKKLTIRIPESDVNSELNEAYRELKQTAKIKGFRPGKIPRSILAQRFGKDVNANISSKLIQSSLEEAIRDNKLPLAGAPEFEPPEFKGKGPIEYEIVVEVRPELEEIDFKGLKLKKTMYAPDDQEVDLQLRMLQKNLSSQTPIEEDRPVETGDHVLLDYEGFHDGEPHEELQKTENTVLKIGAGAILAELDDGLIGMKKGESKDIPVTFPGDYVNKSLSNLDITFKVTLNEIRQETLPEIDDDMAGKLGPYETMDQVKEAIGEDLKQRYAQRSAREVSEQAFVALLDKVNFEVPECMVKEEMKKTISEFERSLTQQDKTLEDAGLTREGIGEKYRDVAEEKIRRQLILGKIIHQEKLTVSDQELDDEIQKMAQMQDQPYEELKKYVRGTDGMADYLKAPILERKAVGLILDNSDMEEIAPTPPTEEEKEPAEAAA